jgi:thioredoxin 1
MKTPVKLLIVAAVALAAVAAVALKQQAKSLSQSQTSNSTPMTAAVAAEGTAAETIPPAVMSEASPAATAKLPRLVDLGASKCIPCKMMKPILDDLKANYADRFTTVFLDVWENPDEGKKYGIQMIPTQIFYDAEGKERFRHMGFYSKEDILGKWKELGVDVSGKSPAAAN